MGNVMAGLGLALLGIILFQVANTFFLYPAQGEVEDRRVYYVMKGVAFLLFGAGTVLIVTGYL